MTRRPTPTSIADAYRATWKALEISNDDFIRTTDPRPRGAVQELWKRARGAGDIYLGDYEGWYCVALRAVLHREGARRRQLLPGAQEAGREGEGEVVLLPALEVSADRLLALLRRRTREFIQPRVAQERGARLRRAAGCGSVGLAHDLQLGRAGAGPPEHVIYVWIDALSNYYSAIGAGKDARGRSGTTGVEIVHIIGKEILALPRRATGRRC